MTSAEHFGLNQARAYRRAITETIDLLAMHPGIGRGEGRRTRPYPAQSHRIFYRADGVTLTVVRILHARQLPPGFE
ncbi:MAG: type II toxin-antitoxin system RelE/ParE family toxin [Oceanicaulis sp.]